MVAPTLSRARVGHRGPSAGGEAWRVRLTVARTLTVIWVAACLFVMIAELANLDTRQAPLAGIIAVDGVVLVLVTALAMLPWYREALGGALLLLAGLIPTVAIAILALVNGIGGVQVAGVVVGALIFLSPLIAGALFLAHARAVRRERIAGRLP